MACNRGIRGVLGESKEGMDKHPLLGRAPTARETRRQAHKQHPPTADSFPKNPMAKHNTAPPPHPNPLPRQLSGERERKPYRHLTARYERTHKQITAQAKQKPIKSPPTRE
ncbi:hypothetical protein DFR29_108189 [Tahibacter aquaticus]|uniref:Uncharacterized protein n=1 Tax=Tahibacter aquaticus TaxID=520092 RepID=A0A4R6YVG2_9GAMM|nr:hypothetical protein DFR29_108189 [Tahibacter aquaticus]